jgi:8-amino-3,8-dideoxy-alpha-D-manno-octulosonate transaminase
MNRRQFVAASAITAGIRKGAQAESTDRKEPLRATFWGPEYYDDKEREQLNDVLESHSPFRWYGPGKQPPGKAAAFEREFAARMGTRYALAVTSGTAALQCAVNALAIGPGDEVILPAWTWHSCYTAVVLAGALPVFAEIDASFNIDPDDIEHRVTPQTKAIIAVHLQGNPCDLERVLAIAKKHRLRVIEDCAQSVGAAYKGRPVGSMGDIGIYSLQLNKTITAGEGGAVVTNEPVLFERAARFHDVGALRQPHEQWVGERRLTPFAGTNFRMNEFSAGVLLAQLRKLDRIVGDVRTNSRRVYEGVRSLPGIELRKLPDPEGELGAGVYLGFKNKDRREAFLAAMKRENVIASAPAGSVILPIEPYIEKKATVHPDWPSFTSARGRAIQYGASACPKTIATLERFGGVLMDPKFTVRDTDDIVAAIRKVYPEIVGS